MGMARCSTRPSQVTNAIITTRESGFMTESAGKGKNNSVMAAFKKANGKIT